MGLPQLQNPSSTADTTTTSPPAKPASSSSSAAATSQLPPEALDLATKLFDFARTGQTASLQQYISAGIPVNLTNHKGDTLLMLATYHGHMSTVQMLVEKGAELDILNDRGQSIVAGAVFKGYGDIVKYLAEQGADLAAGQPNAIESAQMFQRRDLLRLFGVEDVVGGQGGHQGVS